MPRQGPGQGGSTGTGPSQGSWYDVESDVTQTLNAVWVIASADVWAVGDGVVAHYDGVEWARVEGGVLPQGSQNADWRSVSATAPDDVWIAGTQPQEDGPVLIHYDGEQWTTMLGNADAVAGEEYAFFGMVADGDTLWIADGILGGNDHGFAYFYDGMVDERYESFMRSVAVVGDHVFFGADPGQVVYYDGSDWQTSSIESGGMTDQLVSIHGSATNDVWAVGPRKRVHFDGSEWAVEDLENEAYGVWGSGPDDVWTVGERFEHFDGSSWKAELPPREDVVYRGVHGGEGVVWAVGDEGAIALLRN